MRLTLALAALLLPLVDTFTPRLTPAARRPTALSARVVVVGGGFGGLSTCLKLAATAPAEVDITLVAPDAAFTFQPLLYELAVGRADADEVVPSYASLLPERVTHVQQAAEGLDVAARTVRLAGDGTLEYDALVVATGRRAAVPPFAAAAGALAFRDARDAEALHARLAALGVPVGDAGAAAAPPPAGPVPVVVVGGGYTGVELACTLARASPRLEVTLLQASETVLPSGRAANAAAAARALEASGVRVRLGARVEGIDAADDGGGRSTVRCAGSEAVPAALVVWTAGNAAAGLDDAAGALEVDGAARYVVDDRLRCAGQADVYAIGDCAALRGPDADVAPSAQLAIQQADVLAFNVKAQLAGRRAYLPFRYLPLGEMLTFGAVDGAVATVGNLSFQGLAAAVGRRAAYAFRMPTPRQRQVAAVSSLRSSLRAIRRGQAK